MSGKGSDTVVEHDAGYGKDSGTFHCAAGWVRYTSGSRIMTGNPAWLYAYAPAFTSGALAADKPYYVYMRVSGESGTFIVSETPKDLTAGSIRYLLLGILDSEQFGNRSWCPLYGYTEITPGRIRVNKIISSDGKTYFDLKNNEIGGRINFKDGIISENVDMTNAIIRGKIISNVIELTQANFNEYTMDLAVGNSIMKVMNFNKLLGVKTTLVIKYQPQQFAVYVPFIEWFGDSLNKSPMNKFCNLDDFIGNRIRIINESNYPFGISLVDLEEEGNKSQLINQNTEMCIECVCGANSRGRKNILWKVKYKGDIVDYN